MVLIRELISPPLEVEFKERKRVAFCGCKHTNKPPFCDGTHSTL
ncbi:MAG: CDGSH iron-sulfur domain-containing protein [Nitrospirota bacterium]|nr:CDGSH iron-sulfur domain-containing protein [Nitrospirota bacterium]